MFDWKRILEEGEYVEGGGSEYRVRVNISHHKQECVYNKRVHLPPVGSKSDF